MTAVMRVGLMASRVGGHGLRPISGCARDSAVRPRVAAFQGFQLPNALRGRDVVRCKERGLAVRGGQRKTVSYYRSGAKGRGILGRPLLL